MAWRAGPTRGPAESRACFNPCWQHGKSAGPFQLCHHVPWSIMQETSKVAIGHPNMSPARLPSRQVTLLCDGALERKAKFASLGQLLAPMPPICSGRERSPLRPLVSVVLGVTAVTAQLLFSVAAPDDSVKGSTRGPQSVRYGMLPAAGSERDPSDVPLQPWASGIALPALWGSEMPILVLSRHKDGPATSFSGLCFRWPRVRGKAQVEDLQTRNAC